MPVPGPDEVLVALAFCGVCGSDVSEFESGPLNAHVAELPHLITGHTGPVTLGHEMSGYVVESPADGGLTVGALVTSSGGVTCGGCRQCAAGRPNLCERYHIVGMHRNGGLAAYCTIPVRACLDATPFRVSPSTAALAQPMAIALHALRRGDPSAGGRVAVVGAGGIGAFLVYAAVESGADVFAIDVDDDRIALARRLGATALSSGPLGGRQGSTAQARSFDVVFETSGTPQGLSAAVELCDRGGRLVLVGIQAPGVGVEARDIALGELDVRGSVSLDPSRDLPEALRVLATREDGWADVAPTAFPLRDVAREGLSRAASRTRIKTLFAPALAEPCDITRADDLVVSRIGLR
ncbi:alcohol dehydrogenase catalytic domain-containing protein [Pseudonocardia kujensis]|uniref:zinc-dependent alcohol dehydrogenase n=1 Tax=Pseudonocardia kujensis TaxID=1128675 RepID=UPI001E5E5B12|nr:alcohol dehydrogenase catalytic domain-containing protein [Pseudonocardia kujensis]MCE0765067.1 alcohol dehydrogenase catalytic domain-containing protein [Pseudonocardia kujensis]